MGGDGVGGVGGGYQREDFAEAVHAAVLRARGGDSDQ